MKSFYSDYTMHMIRFYLKYEICPDRDIENWKAVDKVFKELPKSDIHILREVLTAKGVERLSTVVKAVSEKTGEKEWDIWELLRRTQRSIAKERRLI